MAETPAPAPAQDHEPTPAVEASVIQQPPSHASGGESGDVGARPSSTTLDALKDEDEEIRRQSSRNGLLTVETNYEPDAPASPDDDEYKKKVFLFRLRIAYIAAGLSNIFGITIVSKFFTSDTMISTYPELFATEGQLIVILWGLAYIAVAPAFELVPLASCLFALEKLTYVILWIVFLARYDNPMGLYKVDFLTGFFYNGFGITDSAWGIFFGYCAVYSFRFHTPVKRSFVLWEE